ncbi:Site-specific recombinase, resolvase family protein (fragment) [Vibrio crassostreae]
MIKASNDMRTAMSRKDYEERRRRKRQKEGIEKAKKMVKYQGKRLVFLELHEQIYKRTNVVSMNRNEGEGP